MTSHAPARDAQRRDRRPSLVIEPPFAMADVPTGAWFLAAHLAEPAAVVRAGRLTAVCASSPGICHLELVEGQPAAMTARRWPPRRHGLRRGELLALAWHGVPVLATTFGHDTNDDGDDDDPV